MAGQAKIEDATLTPTKNELLRAWLPTQPWFDGDTADLSDVAAFRLVDPAGEVGIQTLLVQSGGVTYQVPVTYRPEPLPEAEEFLVGTMEHSTLGTRWTYDGQFDPVYLAETVRTIAERDTEADLSRGPKTMTARGTGAAEADPSRLQIVRVLADTAAGRPLGEAPGLLVGHWNAGGVEQEAVLVVAG